MRTAKRFSYLAIRAYLISRSSLNKDATMTGTPIASPGAALSPDNSLPAHRHSALPTADPWTACARPAFLYVMYAMILWAIPLGVLGAFRPQTARTVAQIISAYLNGLPEPLYALFGTGYIGYTAARQWGKARGTDR